MVWEEFVVMPNHPPHKNIIPDYPSTQSSIKPPILIKTQNKFGPQSQNMASIIRGYKTGVKKYATQNKINFAWQSRFYDHIIRDDKSFLRIGNYVMNNPYYWKEDQFLNNKLFKFRK
ncbi:MAG: hypothetical protein Q8907_13405 [Bacteroidota bacterium]|nr:hypothetical protein [Bacteroidota bacterium]MDP4275268.1 hypothetical protein [Bacteroidota bacterium]